MLRIRLTMSGKDTNNYMSSIVDGFSKTAQNFPTPNKSSSRISENWRKHNLGLNFWEWGIFDKTSLVFLLFSYKCARVSLRRISFFLWFQDISVFLEEFFGEVIFSEHNTEIFKRTGRGGEATFMTQKEHTVIFLSANNIFLSDNNIFPSDNNVFLSDNDTFPSDN